MSPRGSLVFVARGGKKKGAGRPTRGNVRRVLVSLDSKESRRLDRLQVKRRETASEVLRAGLVSLEESGETLEKGLAGGGKPE